MDIPWDTTTLDRLAEAALAELRSAALTSAVISFYQFTLVLARVSGLMIIGPLFGQSIVPANIRILLVVTLTLLVTPALHHQAQIGFDRLDRDGNGRIAQEEVPPHLQRRFDGLLQLTGRGPHVGLSAEEFQLPATMPPTLVEYTGVVLGELSLGLVLGLGVMTLLSGLQLAGQLIDHQTGTAFGEVVNPGLDMEGSLTGQTLFLLGVTVMLMSEPISGHIQMLTALLETFQTFPPGEAWVTAASVDLLRDLVHQSLVLAVQVAAPVLGVMTLVGLAMGFLGHTVPQVNLLIVGFPVRAMLGTLLLAASMSGVGRLIADSFPVVVDELRASFASGS